MPFSYNGVSAKKLYYNGTEVKKAYYNNTIFFQSEAVVVGALTLASDSSTITVSDLPFTPDGFMAVSTKREDSGTNIRCAVYYPVQSIGFCIMCSDSTKVTSSFTAAVSGGEITIGCSSPYARWESGAEILYVAWTSGAGVMGDLALGVGFPATVTVSNLGFTPQGVFAFSTKSTTSFQGIRAMQQDAGSAAANKLFVTDSETQQTGGVFTVSGDSATFGVSRDQSSYRWATHVYYFIW